MEFLDGHPPSLLKLCAERLAQNLIKYGPKKVRFCKLSQLPGRALESLLDILVAKNALNDNVLPHALTRQTRKLRLEGSSQLRRCVLNTIGRSCPNLRILDVRACHQVDNRIVRDVLQHCEHLETLRLDGCTRISDSAFQPALWKPPLAGLLSLKELSVGKCGQITAEGLMGYVMKSAPFLKTLSVSCCKLAITDEIASELIFTFGLECLDLSFCAQLTDAAFEEAPSSALRELRLAGTSVGDAAVEGIAVRSPALEVFDAGWVMKLTDRGLQALTETWSKLRCLCVCNTQITDASFYAIVRCRHLERLDASWCLRASTRALDILANAEERPPLKAIVLQHLGAIGLGPMAGDCFGLPPPPLSPLLFDNPKAHFSSSPHWHPGHKALEPPSLALPPPMQPLAPVNRGASGTSVEEELFYQAALPQPLPLPSLKQLALAYGPSLQQLLLDGIRDVADAAALEAIAANCQHLQKLALTFAGRESDASVEAGLCAIGGRCVNLNTLLFDSSSRPHRAVVSALVPPSFPRLRVLTLCCSQKGNGLLDHELEMILTGRQNLESLAIRNCAGLSEGLFSKWTNRGDRHDEAVSKKVDQALLSSLFGARCIPSLQGGKASALPSPSVPRRQGPRCPAAVTLRTVTSFSLGGALAITDRSCDALVELLHDAQVVDLRGCPLLTEESLRSIRKGCRFIRAVTIVNRERSLSWTAAASSVKKRPNRRSTFCASGSSGTESN